MSEITELEDYQEFIMELVEMGLQTRKVPWVCDAYIHDEVARRLREHGVVGRESPPMEGEVFKNE